MNYKQLIYFLKTAELRSIAAAARALDIAQPSISQQIANLEHLLGVTLFDRDFRGVRLTESGEQFRNHAEAIVRQIEQAKLDIRQSKSEPAGKLSIGMTQPIGNVIAVPLLAALEETYPLIDIDLHTGLSYHLIERLKAGEIDVALTSPDNSDMAGLHQEKIFTEKIFLATGMAPKLDTSKELLKRSTIAFTELQNHLVFVTSNQDSLGYMLQKHEERSGICIKKKPPYGQLMTTLRYVVDGYGLMITPSSSFYHLKKLGVIHALEIIEPSLTRDIFFTTSALRPRTNLLTAVQEELYKVITEVYKNKRWIGQPAFTQEPPNNN